MDVTDPKSLSLQPSGRVPPVPWGIRDIVFAILLAAVGVLLLNVLVVLSSFAFHLPLQTNGTALAVFLAFQDLVVVGTAWLFSVVRYRVGWDRLGLRPFSVAFGCSMSLALFVGSYVVRFLYVAIASAFGMQATTQEVLTRLDTRGLGFVLTLFVVAVVAPIAEETFFRGFLYGGLRGRIGIVGAMLVSTIFFTTLHLSIELFIPIFILGLFLAWLYEYTGSLYPGMMLHAANNAFSLIAYFILQSRGLLPP